MKQAYRAHHDRRRLFVLTGEKRKPNKYEWFLSGAIPEAYQAPNDLDTKFLILREVPAGCCWTNIANGKREVYLPVPAYLRLPKRRGKVRRYGPRCEGCGCEGADLVQLPLMKPVHVCLQCRGLDE